MTSVLTAVEPTEGVENMINIKKAPSKLRKLTGVRRRQLLVRDSNQVA